MNADILKYDLINRFPTYTWPETAVGDLTKFEALDGTTVRATSTNLELADVVFKVRQDLLNADRVSLCLTQTQIESLSGVRDGTHVFNLTTGEFVFCNADVFKSAQTSSLFTVFTPLSGVIDATVPFLGSFEEVSSGETSDYTIDFSLANNHLYILVNSITTGGDIVITGTSIDEETGVPTASDTETITVDTTASQHYQTLKKWWEITNVDITTGDIVSINYDLGNIGYYDGFNVNFNVTAYRANIMGSGNAPDLRLRIRKVSNDGDNKFSFVTIEDVGFDGTLSNGAIVDNLRTSGDDRSYTMVSELLVDKQQLVLKQADFNIYFTGGENIVLGTNNEGIIIDLLGQGDAGITNVESIMFTGLISY